MMGCPAARRAFASLVAHDRDDPLATYHLKSLLAGETDANIALS